MGPRNSLDTLERTDMVYNQIHLATFSITTTPFSSADRKDTRPNYVHHILVRTQRIHILYKHLGKKDVFNP